MVDPVVAHLHGMRRLASQPGPAFVVVDDDLRRAGGSDGDVLSVVLRVHLVLMHRPLLQLVVLPVVALR